MSKLRASSTSLCVLSATHSNIRGVNVRAWLTCGSPPYVLAQRRSNIDDPRHTHPSRTLASTVLLC
ncbi:hypothetical protein K1T71_011402 [Dendrolimus kikuchii]|uniref:Uncharacterized protein n=1 Tax=Dendrolimus kikuchii TaxID=765133 RepID=A0ACC1CP38_9NEOP|nr:hypothetical protein K1T71_011402 [Dendrolimus kikuchii]